MMKCHVILVAYGQEALTRLCLASVFSSLKRRTNQDLEWHVWFTDNGTPAPMIPRLDAIVATCPDDVQLHMRRIGVNRFAFPAINSTAKQAIEWSGDDVESILVFSDNDIVWSLGALEGIVERLGEVDAASPQYEFQGRQAFQDGLLSKKPPLVMSALIKLHQDWARDHKSLAVREDTLHSSCFAVRSSTWREIGDFDETFKLVCNDVDWNWRAVRTFGKKIAIYGDLPVFHRAAVTRESYSDKSKIYRSDEDYICRKWGCTYEQFWSYVHGFHNPESKTVPKFNVAEFLAQRDKPPVERQLKSSGSGKEQVTRQGLQLFRGGVKIPKPGSDAEKRLEQAKLKKFSFDKPLKEYDVLFYAANFNPNWGYGRAAHDTAIELANQLDSFACLSRNSGRQSQLIKSYDGSACSPRCVSKVVPTATYLPFKHIVKGGKSILWTLCETTCPPAEWIQIANTYDEVWVSSAFCAQAFLSSGLQVPIHIVPEGLNSSDWVFQERGPVGAKPFQFLFLADADWYNPRKNCQLIYDAFCKAFKGNGQVELVLKISGIHPPLTFPGNVKLVLGKLPVSELAKLYGACDCFLFPSNGEGYGYPPREAMATGAAAIVSDWSALQDLTRVEGLCYSVPVRQLQWVDAAYQRWYPGLIAQHAKILEDDLIDAMLEAVRDPQRTRDMGRRASVWVRENCGITQSCRLFVKQLGL